MSIVLLLNHQAQRLAMIASFGCKHLAATVKASGALYLFQHRSSWSWEIF